MKKLVRVGIALLLALTLGAAFHAALAGAARPPQWAETVPSQPFVAQTLTGDWIITRPITLSNQPIWLNGNLTVAAGGELALHNSRLTVQSAGDGQHGLLVQAGGAIIIEAGSIITAASTSGHFTFTVEAGAPFVMRDSELHGCGSGAPYSVSPDGPHGLAIHSAEPIIENSLLADNFEGVRLFDNRGGLIRNNIFREIFGVAWMAQQHLSQ